MADMKKAATSALNEDDYINKLYDSNLDTQNKLLKEGYTQNETGLDQQGAQVQKQTEEYQHRTGVELQKAEGLYDDSRLSVGARAQVDLTRDNAERKNASILRDAREEADVEIQRQRQLLAKQYEADIRQAQADNDMERAQALYEAAKAEEEQLRALQQQGAELLYGKKRDSSGYEDIENGRYRERDTATPTQEEVLRNEEALNQIYDAKLESMRQQLTSEYETGLSDLEAQRAAGLQEADRKLTEAYTEGMKNRKNYAEVQGAYGQGSGTYAQTMLTRDAGNQEDMTRIRAGQIGADAALQQQGFEAGKAYWDAVREAQHDTDLGRAEALYGAAEEEEQKLIEDQLLVGKHKAKKGDYTILGRLYGLTPEQIDKLSRKSGGSSGSNSYPVLDADTLASAQALQEQIDREAAIKAAVLAGEKAAARERAKNRK